MIHPSTVLKFIDEHKGYGVFATEIIPKGTITYVKDPLEIEISVEYYNTLDAVMQEQVEKYSYIDERGIRIISWDLAKYVNHCCNCNTMSTGYGFEIAIRDISPGEELTDEYGLFNLTQEMELCCTEKNCRKVLKPEDFDEFGLFWDSKVKPAIELLFNRQQPLLGFLDKDIIEQLEHFRSNEDAYRSVTQLKLNNHDASVNR